MPGDKPIKHEVASEADPEISPTGEAVVEDRSKKEDDTSCNCEFCEHCSFFIERLAVLPELARQVRDHYCYQYKYRCARYVLKQLTGKGDPNLLPSDMKTVSDRLGWDL